MRKFISFILIQTIAYSNIYAARIYTFGDNTIADTSAAYYPTQLTNETTTVRTGSRSYGVSSLTSGVRTGNLFVHNASSIPMFLRFYFYLQTAPNTTTSIASINATSPFGSRALVKLSTDTKLSIFVVGSVQVTTDTYTLSTGQWYRVELEYDRNTGTNDIMGLYVDGVYVASSTTLNLNSTFGGFGLGGNMGAEPATSGEWYFDDVGLNDSNTGGNQDSFPGEGSVSVMYPDATGDFAEGASNGAGVGWDDVDDEPSDGSSTYWILQTNSANSTSADRLDVNLESSSNAGIVSGSSINVVGINAVLGNDDSASSTYVTRIKSQASGTIAEGTTVSIDTNTWAVNDDNLVNIQRTYSYSDPQAGGSWTTSLLDTMQIGIRAPDATPDLNVTALWAVVDYVPAAAPSGGGGHLRRRVILSGP